MFFFSVIRQFWKNCLFSWELCAKTFFFQITLVWVLKNLFLALLKHYKDGVLWNVCVFWLLKKKRQIPQKDWNFWFCCCPKMAGFVPTNWCQLSFIVCWSPIVKFGGGIWGCAFFGPSCRKGFFDKRAKIQKKLTDNWKALFCDFFLLFVLFFFWWGGPKGHLTRP